MATPHQGTIDSDRRIYQTAKQMQYAVHVRFDFWIFEILAGASDGGSDHLSSSFVFDGSSHFTNVINGLSLLPKGGR
jgi:hypothetical protein